MITCNYDGYKKNKTFIGENCFIGSNTSLIAPITISKKIYYWCGGQLLIKIFLKVQLFTENQS